MSTWSSRTQGVLLPDEKSRTVIGLLLLALLLMGLSAEVRAAEVEGSVTIKSALKKKAVGRRHRAGYGKPTGEYQTQDGATRSDETLNVVVYLVGAKGKGEGKFPPARMQQKGRQFAPYVLPVRVGTAVEFPNQDIIYHGVYSDSPAKKFELPEYAMGESRSVTFDRPGVVELFCAIHTHMNAYILVLENGYFAVPDAQHRFRISGVPPGRYVLKTWHPRLEETSRVIEVKAEGAQVQLTL